MHALVAQEPACFGRSYFTPGAGPCNLGCRLAAGCRAESLVRARAILRAAPAALDAEERAFVASHEDRREPPALAEVIPLERDQARRPRAPWTAEHRRPVESFKPTSVAALAVEVLRAAALPLHVDAIATEVLRIAPARGARLAGKTPAATVGLALRHVAGVGRVGRGTYAWQGDSSAPSEGQP